jgi:hypothetical protein
MPSCPSCRSSNTKRREQLWLEGQSFVTHKDGNTSHRLSVLAEIHSPPDGPESYPMLLVEAILLLAAAAGTTFLVLTFVRALAIPILVSCVAGAFLYLSPRLRTLSQLVPSIRSKVVTQHREAYGRYEKQWACQSCGHLFERESAA